MNMTALLPLVMIQQLPSSPGHLLCPPELCSALGLVSPLRPTLPPPLFPITTYLTTTHFHVCFHPAHSDLLCPHPSHAHQACPPPTTRPTMDVMDEPARCSLPARL